jgi:hypothetical protein
LQLFALRRLKQNNKSSNYKNVQYSYIGSVWVICVGYWARFHKTSGHPVSLTLKSPIFDYIYVATGDIRVFFMWGGRGYQWIPKRQQQMFHFDWQISLSVVTEFECCHTATVFKTHARP